MRKALIIFILLIAIGNSFAQTIISGKITDVDGKSITGVNISINQSSKGTISDQNGQYRLEVSPQIILEINFSHISFITQTKAIRLEPDEQYVLNLIMESRTEVLKEVKVEGEQENREEVSVINISPKSVEALPTPFGDFNKILATLPGVISNNELSSTYSVRGGNFDENQIYVNNIPIYRPFLLSNGQQEGLSFVNTNLVSAVEFSAGGWQPKFGDKLSSVLNVNYKKPREFGASANIGLLGGTVHVEGTSKNQNISYVLGARHKSAQYLLNTLETNGQYLPKFSDFQSFVNFKISEKTSLGVLGSYARNRYLVEPESRETEFGTFNLSLRLFVAFEGREILEYDTWQGGVNLTHQLTSNWQTELITSGVYATEREFTDVEGGYRLCDVDKNLGSATFNDCVFTRGIGTNYDFGRNTLDANIINIENRNTIYWGNSHTFEFGVGYAHEDIEDELSEVNFIDSANFVTIEQTLASVNRLKSNRLTGYLQNTFILSPEVTSTVGVRLNYWDYNNQLLVSPRWQISYRPDWSRDILFKGAIGIYQQPPFYRELRDFEGNLNPNLLAQKSFHIIAGLDYNFEWWDRKFKFIGEVYYKGITNAIAYDVDNVKIRYFANNDTKAFATGLDLRVNGEFIPGLESWFSLGLLNTQEDVQGDDNGFIRRPTDQRVNAAIFFQDHLPNNPSVRVSLNVLFGSGLPFGPPNSLNNRNSFNGDSYKRVDVGFAKAFYLNKEKFNQRRQLLLSAEVLNLLGSGNAISYLWIQDVNNNNFAVPNSLSARFLNVKLGLKI